MTMAASFVCVCMHACTCVYVCVGIIYLPLGILSLSGVIYL